MNDCKLRNQHGELVDSTQPIPTNSIGAKTLATQSETIVYNGKAATGAITVVSTSVKPIMSVEGDQVASHWNNEKNKVYEVVSEKQNTKKDTKWVLSVVLTAGAAEVNVYDPNSNLENMFESLTGTVKRFVLHISDTDGNELYGWVFGVAKSGNTYTLDIVNNRLSETRNWVGDASVFKSGKIKSLSVYRYNSSVVFGTGTCLTEEVVCPREYSKSWRSQIGYASKLSNGEYFIDYYRGRIIGVKADTTASESVSYKVLSPLGSSVESSGGSVPSVSQSITSGVKAVGAGATALNATSLKVKKVFITAKATNTAFVWVGDSTVDTTKGTPLIQTDRMEIENVDLADVYINGTATDEVFFNYFI